MKMYKTKLFNYPLFIKIIKYNNKKYELDFLNYYFIICIIHSRIIISLNITLLTIIKFICISCLLQLYHLMLYFLRFSTQIVSRLILMDERALH